MLSKLNTLFHTLIHLKPIQAVYQVKNRLIKVSPLSSFHLPILKTQKLDFFHVPAIHPFLKDEPSQVTFTFLNLSQTYPKSSIDWNDQTHGKLWNYNLQYLDFLKQDDIPVKLKVEILNDLYSWLWTGKLPLEPYPASLRIMNLVRFLSTQEIEQASKDELTKFLLAEVNYLSKNPEFHLLANHLLENAFALWMGALFFNHAEWIAKASQLLKSQLEEQILSDGAHYELTPMYHQIILFRVLEAYHLSPNQYVLKFILKEKAELMLGWLNQMTFPNGSLPHFNDTTEGIAYGSAFLQETGRSLDLLPNFKSLSESGYRKLEFEDLCLISDVEGIKPSYQPGHAHADTFSFVLHKGEVPVIVDPGISTYTIGSRRAWERGTASHNTITIDQKNSSQVWAGFRVAKRTKVNLKSDNSIHVLASQDGFGGQLHQREFKVLGRGLEIKDEILNYNNNSILEARLFFHPAITPKFISSARIQLLDSLILELFGAEQIQLIPYEFALGFNKLKSAQCLLISLESNSLTTRFIPS